MSLAPAPRTLRPSFSSRDRASLNLVKRMNPLLRMLRGRDAGTVRGPTYLPIRVDDVDELRVRARIARRGRAMLTFSGLSGALALPVVLDLLVDVLFEYSYRRMDVSDAVTAWLQILALFALVVGAYSFGEYELERAYHGYYEAPAPTVTTPAGGETHA